MDETDQRARKILDYLANQINHGWGSFLVAKHIHLARVGRRINSAYYFFGIAEASCVETAAMALSRIFIPHDDSITIPYLLNYAEQNPQVFSRIDRPTILERIEEHRQELNSISSLISNLKEQRDHALAHLDKKHITNPDAVYTHPPLDYNEVEKTFPLALNIVNTYSRFLVPSNEFRLDSLEPGIVDDISYLTGLIMRDNARS
jgi:hypothetical protein